MRDAWETWKGVPKVVRVISYVVLGMIVIGVAFGDSSTEDSDAPVKIATTDQAEPASNRETEAAEPPDTGRMSGDEYDQATSALDDFEAEVQQLSDGLTGKCSVILSAGQLAEGSECVSEAADGLEDQAGLSYSVLDDLRPATAKTCRRRVTQARNALDRYYTTLKQAKEYVENLQTDETVTAVYKEVLEDRSAYYRKTRTRLLSACSPT